MSAAADLEQQLADAVSQSTGGAWKLTRAWSERQALCLSAEVPAPTRAGGASLLLLEVCAAQRGARAYRVVGDLSFSYRLGDSPLSTEQLRPLERVVSALAAVLSRHEFSPAVDVLAGRDDSAFPTPYHRAYLDGETPLPTGTVDAYRRDGHVLVRRALQRDVVLAARPSLLDALGAAWPKDLPPVEERPDAYSQSFTQITDISRSDARVRLFSHAHRIARMAAELMGVDGVRCFCEDWLVKEPGARITPWHQDEAVFPFEAAATITCWIPLQDVGEGDGLLRFARGSHRMGIAPTEDISDVSEAEFAHIIAEHGFPIDELPPVFVGDVSFHDGRMIHGAFPNRGAQSRIALALHCFADGARVKRPNTPRMAAILAGSAPGDRRATSRRATHGRSCSRAERATRLRRSGARAGRATTCGRRCCRAGATRSTSGSPTVACASMPSRAPRSSQTTASSSPPGSSTATRTSATRTSAASPWIARRG
jgi:hypothetical protein